MRYKQSKKGFVTFLSGMLVINSTMGSSLPSMAMDSIMARFSVTATQQRVLPISVYLIGYVFGPIVWGPLSEHFGRRLLSIFSFSLFCVFTLACGFAPNWPGLLVFRFFCGVCGSCPIAVVAGILADIYSDPRARGKAFAIFMVVCFYFIFLFILQLRFINAQAKTTLLMLSRPPPLAPCWHPSSPASAPRQSAGAGPSTLPSWSAS